MKKESYPVLIYRNEKFEQDTRAGMKVTFDALVKLLAIWDDLDLGPCGDIYRLANNATKVYTDTYNARVEVPETIGKYQISKGAFLNILSIPVPNDLYVAARSVTKTPCYGYQEIWSIKDGKVYQDDARAEEIIHSQNIYAHNPEQEELGRAVIEYIWISNFLDKRFTEIPWPYLPAMPWSLVGKHFANLSMLTLEVEQLLVIMSNL